MTELKRPVLCIVAGPNGAGKTSTTTQLLKNEWSEGSLYINPDNIAQEVYGDWNSHESIIKAAQDATDLRYKCLSEGRDFVFETVFSSDEKLEFVKKAKEAGFFIRFFYICTQDPTINVQRVAKRYLTGGHEVPISKIITRYYKSLINAAVAIAIVDRAYIYDNSVENEPPKLLYRTVDGVLLKKYITDLPEWAESFIK
ncbi:zeta toxin family protein [Tannerella sp.]|uniref:zeta toxin family protein n=1 Tax=Tannerella sp. TaxID=2382127 RepID=UPI0026DBD9B7|nr:zeta toxin family protein [Tannerella sp.]MDO4702421.1 zeta toxin family protein [Tannerella sp.]